MLPDFLEKKDENSFRDFLGARKETILRLERLYQEDYFSDEDKYNKRQIMHQQEMARIKKYFNLENGGSVLDIGCGTGEFLSLFSNKWEKYGTDVSGYALEKAAKRGITTQFDFKDNMFDIIIFRGTIQHIPDPISRIEKCYYWLNPGGVIIFLATPNINSIYYKLFNTLPMLSEARNFFLPSDLTLSQILTNFGFLVKGVEYPYLGCPYAKPAMDLINFLLKLFRIKKNIKFAFYKNLMEVYAQKPK